MTTNKYAWLPALLCIMAFVSGCGDASGGAEYYDTVMVTASSEVTNFDADVITAGVVEPSTITVSVSSESIPNSPDFVVPSKVRIESVQISYTPADVQTPALGTVYLALGQFVDPDGTTELDIMILSQQQKINDPLVQLRNSGTIYQYYATLTFRGVEVTTGKRGSFETRISLSVADFAD